MKNLSLTLIALAAIGVAAKTKFKNNNIFSVTVTNCDDELLVDVTDKNIIFHDDVKVYINSKPIN